MSEYPPWSVSNYPPSAGFRAQDNRERVPTLEREQLPTHMRERLPTQRFDRAARRRNPRKYWLFRSGRARVRWRDREQPPTLKREQAPGLLRERAPSVRARMTPLQP